MKTFHTICCNALLIALLFLTNHATAMLPDGKNLYVSGMKIEYLENPVGIDNLNPRFFWMMESSQKNTLQTAYQIQVALSKEAFKNNDLLWDSQKVFSDKSIQVVYQGPSLKSGTRYFWRVKIWDNHKNTSDWSDPSFWEMGLLDPEDWNATWIEPELETEQETPDTVLISRSIFREQPAYLLRSEFNLKGKVSSARVYITCHGVYEMLINGNRVSDHLFAPGWTSYNHRLQYQTYDVTELLQSGENAVGVSLSDGWYTKPYISWAKGEIIGSVYGDKLALLAQINIVYEDGSTEMIQTGNNWRWSTGPILSSDLYNGEIYDARLEKKRWAEPGYNDSDWGSVKTVDHSKTKLIATMTPPVKIIQEIKPVDIFITPEGDTVVDMGQNMVGWIQLKVQGKAGTEVTLRHAEVLDKAGNFYMENLAYAKATNKYILKGEGVEIWEPHFTFQGFRYVAVHGYPGELKKEALTGRVIHSDLIPTGHFECSNALVNQLQHNILWGQKGNFLDIPTDCPQRSERFGWTGDAQVFVRAANINMNTATFFTKWLGDVEADQFPKGQIAHMVPNVFTDDPGSSGSAGWADAAVIVPWSVYQSYADTEILEKQYNSMKKWVDFVQQRAESNGNPFIWDNDFTFGDWLNTGANTDRDIMTTAYFGRSADLLRNIAHVLGKEEDEKKYTTLFENIKNAFQREFVTPNGRMITGTQTSYLLALRYNLLDESLKAPVAANLAKEVKNRGHLTTGFLGTPHLNFGLSENGYTELAYNLLLRTQYPSWLFPITMGATTIWERWDGIKPDSTFQTNKMNSFNHYAYGAIGEWLYKEVSGINAVTPGYKNILIHPKPGGGLTHARAFFHSLYGKIECSWEFKNDIFYMKLEIPDNTVAEVVLPYAAHKEVTESGSKLKNAKGIISFREEEINVTLKLGSGQYRFAYSSDSFAPEILSALNKNNIDPGTNEVNTQTVSFGIKNKIGELLANTQSRDILFQELPELMNSPWLSQVMGFSLERSMESLPQELRISKEKLALIDTKLRNLDGLK